MYLNMVTPLELIEDYIKGLVTDEINADGLLSDVQSYKTLFKDLSITNTPAVWIYLGEWNIEEETLNKNNSRATLVYDVEISVICNKSTLEESDRQATSIQARLTESIIKNWKRLLSKEMNVQNPFINIETGYNDGKLRVANKQTRVVIKGILCRFKFTLDWIRCIHKQNVIVEPVEPETPVNPTEPEDTGNTITDNENNNNNNGG